MDTYHIIAVLIFLTSVFAYINDRWIKWAPTIGIMVIALFSSILIAIGGYLFPSISSHALLLVSNIDFEQVLMKIMLSFLLFAGALHIDANKLNKQKRPVMVLAKFKLSTPLLVCGSEMDGDWLVVL